MIFVQRAGCAWRDMKKRHGKWNSAYVRFKRWAEPGIRNAKLETLVEPDLTVDWQHMTDSATLHGHSPVAGARGDRRVALYTDHIRIPQDARETRLHGRRKTPGRT